MKRRAGRPTTRPPLGDKTSTLNHAKIHASLPSRHHVPFDKKPQSLSQCSSPPSFPSESRCNPPRLSQTIPGPRLDLSSLFQHPVETSYASDLPSGSRSGCAIIPALAITSPSTASSGRSRVSAIWDAARSLDDPSASRCSATALSLSPSRLSVHRSLRSRQSRTSVLLSALSTPSVPRLSVEGRTYVPSVDRSLYSRPYSRSGARAPEPADEYPDWNAGCMGRGRGPEQFRGFRGSVKRKVFNIARTLTKLRRRRRTHHSRRSSVSSVVFDPDQALSVHRHPSHDSLPFEPGRISLSSNISAVSAGSSMLESWLEDRRRQSLEREFHRGQGDVDVACMSLEEYDQRGSWLLQASPIDRDGFRWPCGHPSCPTHSPEQISCFEMDSGGLCIVR